jgi:hypothetical protein
MFVGGAKHADAVIFADGGINQKLIDAIKPTRSKKVLNFDSLEDDITNIMDLYNNLAG